MRALPHTIGRLSPSRRFAVANQLRVHYITLPSPCQRFEDGFSKKVRHCELKFQEADEVAKKALVLPRRGAHRETTPSVTATPCHLPQPHPKKTSSFLGTPRREAREYRSPSTSKNKILRGGFSSAAELNLHILVLKSRREDFPKGKICGETKSKRDPLPQKQDADPVP